MSIKIFRYPVLNGLIVGAAILGLVIYLDGKLMHEQKRAAVLEKQVATQQQQVKKLEQDNTKLTKDNAALELKLKQIFTPATEKIIDIISFYETNRGKTGVGAEFNNPTGLKCANAGATRGWCSYPTLQAGYTASYAAWERSYKSLPLDSSLAKWKTGNPGSRTPDVTAYITNIKQAIWRAS